MPLVIIKGSPGRVEEIFVAAEPIGKLATVYIIAGASARREVKEGETQYQAQRGGISIAGAVSGAIVRVVTAGFVSGAVCVSAVVPGDRIAIACQSGGGLTSGTLASGFGKITPFNIITPAGNFISGSFASGATPPVSGAFTGTAFNTARVLGLALTSASPLSGQLIGAQILVMPGG